MKILILIQTSLKEPYPAITKAQLDTWMSVDVEGVTARHYFCSEYELMHVPFRTALIESLESKEEWDYLFRTNVSSYVDKQMLMDFAENLPRENLYSGKSGGDFASGAGFWLSRDVAEKLAYVIPSFSHPYEDVLIGQIMTAYGIRNAEKYERCDINFRDWTLPLVYQYRVKSDNQDRRKDVSAMHRIHEFLGK